MNDFDERLTSSVAATASFDAADVARRVARRRRRRRAIGAAAVALVAVVGVGAAVALTGDDGPDVQAVDDPPTTTSAAPDVPAVLVPVPEDPVGADGVTGTMSDLHVETTETFGFVECGADGEPGPPTGERATELEALIDDLRDAGLHDQPFVVSSGGPQSIWGVPTVGLSSRYQPTLQWLADRVDAADVCLEVPEFGVRNRPPALAPVAVSVAASFNGVTVTAEGCQPKGEWIEPFIRRIGERAELGIAVGQGAQEAIENCPVPTTYSFPVTGEAAPTIATEPGTLFFDGPVGVGITADFTFDPVNVASESTMGDDVIAQLATDPTVQFQVSDVFSDDPLAGAVGEVATDQWPITGRGTVVVPESVPAGTYFVRFVANPELNGTLEVTGPADERGESSMGPDWGWLVPDLDGDAIDDVVDGATGQLRLTTLGVLSDGAGGPVTVPMDGDHVFTCNPDGDLYEQWDAPIDDERFSRRLAALRVVDGVGEWGPSPSFVFEAGEAPLPPRGQGCEPFGTHPQPAVAGSVADGEVSDVHVEATDMVFPDCESLPQTGSVDRPRLDEVLARLRTDGVMDQPFINSVGSLVGFVDAIEVILQRRYQPTLDWLAARAAPDEVCLLLVPPVGFFTQPPSNHAWELVAAVEPTDTNVTLTEPVGDRDIVPLVGPTVRFSPYPVPPRVGTPFAVAFDPAGLGGETTMGDDVMLQSVDDPSIQIQIGGVFTDSPTTGVPAPIVTDRWAATGEASLVIPGDTPSGGYTFVFIEHPQFWGTLTVA